MTTEVIIKANANWAVLVQPLGPGGAIAGPTKIVERGEQLSAYVHGNQDLFIREIDPNPARIDTAADRLLAFFTYQHLPTDLLMAAMPFAGLAVRLVATLPAGAERTVCLRKLLEAKDCAVRAVLESRPQAGA